MRWDWTFYFHLMFRGLERTAIFVFSFSHVLWSARLLDEWSSGHVADTHG